MLVWHLLPCWAAGAHVALSSHVQQSRRIRGEVERLAGKVRALHPPWGVVVVVDPRRVYMLLLAPVSTPYGGGGWWHVAGLLSAPSSQPLLDKGGGIEGKKGWEELS
jgi:hypothetical protein